MKLGNMLEIIDIVRKGPVSRADVARATGLTRAAVTIIVDRLVREGILFEPDTRDGDRRAKNILLDIREDSFTFMGVDITRVNCSAAITDVKGRCLETGSFKICPDAPFDSILPDIAALMRGIYGRLGNPGRLMGVGISVPGPVDSRSGVVLNPPNFGMLHNQRVLDRLKGVLDCDMWLDNNAAARTLYEKNLGAARHFGNFMVMTVDTGVGSGLVLDGRLFRGLGFAGEAGHTSINIDGPACPCGNRGCLEGYAAIPALLARECAGRADITSWKDVVDRAEQGDGLCLQVIEKQARYLLQSIVNTANLLDLEAVILTGDIAYRPELLLGRIRQAVQGVRITGRIHDLEILTSAEQPNAGAVSATTIAMEKFLEGQSGWNIPA